MEVISKIYYWFRNLFNMDGTSAREISPKDMARYRKNYEKMAKQDPNKNNN